jgi:hypothetical protein
MKMVSMMSTPARIFFVSVVLGATLSTAIRAEMCPTMPIRYMAIEADVILVGAPVGDHGKSVPSKYKVIKVLKGSKSLVGQEVVIRDEKRYSLSPPSWQGDEKEKPTPRITKAMLFLRNPGVNKTPKGYRTVLSGIRALTEKGTLLVPQQLMNPGGQYLLPMKGETWEAMLAQVKKDMPSIAEMLRLGKIADPGKRNQAILTWIKNHRDHFGVKGKSWYSLEYRLFDWVMESCIPEDCWAAIQLSSEIGIRPQKFHPSFCSKEGRKLLLAKVLDRSLSDSLRLRALQKLGNGSIWYAHGGQYPRTHVATRTEQMSIIDHVLPMLKSKKASWREASARCLMSASFPYDANFAERATKRAIPDFVRLYRNEKNTTVRKAVVEAIRRIESVPFWQKLSGNPEGIVLFPRFSGITPDDLVFHLYLEHTNAKITEMPVFRFQELRKDGSVIRSRLVKPSGYYPKHLFKSGWQGGYHGSITMRVPAAQVSPGLWRVSLEGRLKEHTWRSEPVEVSIPEKKKSTRQEK